MHRKFLFCLFLITLVAITANAREVKKIENGIYYYEREEASDNGGVRLIKITGSVDADNNPNGLWTGKVIDRNVMNTSYTVWNGTLVVTRNYKHGVSDGPFKLSDTRSYRYRRGGGGRRNEQYSGSFKNGRPHGLWSISSPDNHHFKASLKYDYGVLVGGTMNDDNPYPSLEYYMTGGEFDKYYRGSSQYDMGDKPIFELSPKEKQEMADRAEKSRMEDLQDKALEGFHNFNKEYSYNLGRLDSICYVAKNFKSGANTDSVCNYVFALKALPLLAKADSVCLAYPDGQYYVEWRKYKEQFSNINSYKQAYDDFVSVHLPQIASKYPWIGGSPQDFAGYAMRHEMTGGNAQNKQTEYLREKSEELLKRPLTKADWEHYARYHKFKSFDERTPTVVRLFLKDLIAIQVNNGWKPILDYEELKSRFVKPFPTYADGAPYLPIGKLNVMVVESIYRYKRRNPETHEYYNMIDIKADHYYIGYDRSETYTPEKWEKDWDKIWNKLNKVYTEEQLFGSIINIR